MCAAQPEPIQPDCIFCKIVAGEIPADKVYEDKEVIAFYDIAPKAQVHVLLIPRKHIPTMADVEESDFPLIASLHRAALNVAGQLNIKQDGFRLVSNCKENAGQEVFHLHYHLLGGQPLAMGFGAY